MLKYKTVPCSWSHAVSWGVSCPVRKGFVTTNRYGRRETVTRKSKRRSRNVMPGLQRAVDRTNDVWIGSELSYFLVLAIMASQFCSLFVCWFQCSFRFVSFLRSLFPSLLLFRFVCYSDPSIRFPFCGISLPFNFVWS